jgi:hypothetical protein
MVLVHSVLYSVHTITNDASSLKGPIVFQSSIRFFLVAFELVRGGKGKDFTNTLNRV